MKKDVKNARRKAQSANAGRRRKKRAGRRGLHRVLVLLFFLSAGAVLSLTVLFKIEAVYVVGTDKYDPIELAEASGVMPGQNLLRISKDEIIQNIMTKYPYIKSVEVTRKIPPAVEIQVTQETPDGAVKEEGNYVLITKKGKVLERGIMYISEEIPMIKGLDTTGTLPGEHLGIWANLPKGENESDEQKKQRELTDEKNKEKAAGVRESLTMIAYLFEAMEESGFTDITNVDITDRLNMKVVYENRLILELGSEADMSYKLELLKVIISDKLEPEARGTLFAANARNKKVLFRPAGDYIRESGEEGDKQADDDLDLEIITDTKASLP